MHSRKLLGLLPLASILFAGCYPETPESISEYDVVYTNYSPTYDFTNARTYSLPDSVVLISGNLANGELPECMNPIYGDQILTRIRQNLNSSGWTEVNEVDSADVIVLPSVISSEVVSVYNYGWGYWGWYYPYYGAGWYYPGYYPTYTSYTSGTLLMQMTDPSRISAANDVPVVWLAILNGVLEGSTADLANRTLKSIDQSFTQSEYLKH